MASRGDGEGLTPPLGSDLRCFHVFQISTSASPARVSTACAATWRAPSTASARWAANWTPPTPSAWVRHPEEEARPVTVLLAAENSILAFWPSGGKRGQHKLNASHRLLHHRQDEPKQRSLTFRLAPAGGLALAAPLLRCYFWNVVVTNAAVS